MKKLVILIAVALLITPAVASANLLDGGFEGSGAGPWSYYEASPSYIENFDSSSAARTGSEGLEISWTAPVFAYLQSETKQDISVTEGDSWDASIYAKTVSIVGDAHAYLETLYFSSGGAYLGDDFKLQSSKLTGTNDWTLLTNSGIVPAYAATASYRLMVATGGSMSGSGTVYFDDASPSGDPVIPEPASLMLLGSGLLGLFGIGRKKRS